MKILIIGIGSPVPSFILRRIEALDKHGVNLIIVGDKSSKKQFKLHNSTLITQPGLGLGSLGLWIRLLGTALLNPYRFMRLLICFKYKGFIRGLYLALLHWTYVRCEGIGLIHLQWLSMGNDLSWLKKFFDVPIMASARGSQVTVYPEVRSGYREQIATSICIVDQIHCLSNDIQQRCIQLGAHPKSTFVNYNGIDVEKFKPALKTTRDNKKGTVFRLITIGALMWRKGVHYQMLVLQKLLRRGLPVHLHVVGDGSDKEGLRYQSLRLGLVDAITWEGKCTEYEVIKLLQASDLYLSTSVAEGLANVVVEAAACGLPVVAFDCEGMNEVIKPNVSGLIIEYGRVDLFVEALDRLIRNDILRHEMGRAAREHILQNFIEDRQVESMIEKYQSLINEFQGSAKGTD